MNDNNMVNNIVMLSRYRTTLTLYGIYDMYNRHDDLDIDNG